MMRGTVSVLFRGLLDGCPVLGRKEFFGQYGIVPTGEADPALNKDIEILVNTRTSWTHHFFPVFLCDTRRLAVALSKAKQCDVSVKYLGLYELERFHRGQVVVGYRTLRYFVKSCSDQEDAKTRY